MAAEIESESSCLPESDRTDLKLSKDPTLDSSTGLKRKSPHDEKKQSSKSCYLPARAYLIRSDDLPLHSGLEDNTISKRSRQTHDDPTQMRLISSPATSSSMNTAITVAIVGSAGRNADAPRMTRDLFGRMQIMFRRILSDTFGLSPDRVILVSGGAAWCDHIAVREWLSSSTDEKKTAYAGLHLHLPAKLFTTGFVEAKRRTDPGRTANYYHHQFSSVLCDNETVTLNELVKCSTMRNVTVSDNYPGGFKERNTGVAKEAQFMVAFTWGSDTRSPHMSGGTYDTWKKCHGVKVHVPLAKLVAGEYEPPTRISL